MYSVLLGTLSARCSDSTSTSTTFSTSQGGMGGSAGQGGASGAGGEGGNVPCMEGQTQTCYPGPAGTQNVGACKAGSSVCNGGVWGACTGQVLPGTETCDKTDEDCNGTIDESNPGSGGSCNTGNPGVCAAGTYQCQGGMLKCVSITSASAEIRDGLDNECNGTVDNRNSGGGGSCGTGLAIGGNASITASHGFIT